MGEYTDTKKATISGKQWLAFLAAIPVTTILNSLIVFGAMKADVADNKEQIKTHLVQDEIQDKAVAEKFAQFGESMATVATKLENIKQPDPYLVAIIDMQDERIDELEEREDKLEDKVDTLEDEVDALEKKLEE